MVKKPFKPIISFLATIGIIAGQSMTVLPTNASHIDEDGVEWWSLNEILNHRDEWMNFINNPDCFMEGVDITECRNNYQNMLKYGDYGILTAYSMLHEKGAILSSINIDTNSFRVLYFGQSAEETIASLPPDDLDELLIYWATDDDSEIDYSIGEILNYDSNVTQREWGFYNSLVSETSEAWAPSGGFIEYEFAREMTPQDFKESIDYKYTTRDNPVERHGRFDLDICPRLFDIFGGECRLMISNTGDGFYNTRVLHYMESEAFPELNNELFDIPVAEPDPVEPDPEDPVDPEPVEPEPEDPVDPEPTEPNPVEPDPVDPEPTEEEPVNPEPVNLDPIESDPVDPEPITPEPIDPIPADEELIDVEPILESTPTDGYGADSETLPEIVPVLSEEIVESSSTSTLDEEEYSPVPAQGISYTSSYSAANGSVAEAKTATLSEAPQATPSKDEQKVNLASSEVEQKLTIPQEENATFPWWLIALPISIGGVSAFWLIPNRKK